MGLLDDAIREHLELKRRRGADPTEIERLEREALGPVRRSPHAGHDALLDNDAPAGAVYDDQEPKEGWAHSDDGESLFDQAYEDDLEHELETPRASEYQGEPDQDVEREYEAPRHHEIAEEWEAQQRQPLHGEGMGFEPDEPTPTAPPPAAAPPLREEPSATQRPDLAEHHEQETVEHHVETEHHNQAEGEDVLEETPEFLQDTPDHDRLWFEQRPPREFDLDG